MLNVDPCYFFVSLFDTVLAFEPEMSSFLLEQNVGINTDTFIHIYIYIFLFQLVFCTHEMKKCQTITITFFLHLVFGLQTVKLRNILMSFVHYLNC